MVRVCPARDAVCDYQHRCSATVCVVEPDHPIFAALPRPHVERGQDRRARGRGLSDRWASMSAEELRAECMSIWSAYGFTQAKLYDEIRNLQQRIFEQRTAIQRLESDKAKLAHQIKGRGV